LHSNSIRNTQHYRDNLLPRSNPVYSNHGRARTQTAPLVCSKARKSRVAAADFRKAIRVRRERTSERSLPAKSNRVRAHTRIRATKNRLVFPRKDRHTHRDQQKPARGRLRVIVDKSAATTRG